MAYTADGVEIPQGLSLMMAQDLHVLDAFNNMGEAARQSVIDKARHVQSKAEMQRLVESIGKAE
jgi:hypothetical protein